MSATEDELRAVRERGPRTRCVLCGRTFAVHGFTNLLPGPLPGSIRWCFVPALYVGDETLFFPRSPARFRADPARVRVSVGRCVVGWRARVISNDPVWMPFVGIHRRPKAAVAKALRAAAMAGMPGVDLSMGSTYDHPQAR